MKGLKKLKCERQGCCNSTRKGGALYVRVFDERKKMPTSGKYMKRGAEDYKGHKQAWCIDCVRALEPHQYDLTYFVEGNRLKLKRTKRAKIDKSLVAQMPEPIAPIIDSEFVETVK